MYLKILRWAGLVLVVVLATSCLYLCELGNDSTKSVFLNKIIEGLSSFENNFFDRRTDHTIHQGEIDKRIVLLDIDDQSLKAIGRWPWSREIWAQVMNKLGQYDAKVVVFDVFFSEPEVNSAQTNPDRLLGAAIKNFQSAPGKDRSVIISYYLSRSNDHQDAFQEENIPSELLSNPLPHNLHLSGDNQELATQFALKSNFPIDPLINEKLSGAKLAYISAYPDPDGIFRTYPLVANISGITIFPSLALLAYRDFTHDENFTGEIRLFKRFKKEERKIALNLKNGEIPIDYYGQMKIRWFGGINHFPRLSVHDLLTAKNNDSEIGKILANTIVFVGSTAVSTFDLRHTPIDEALPGVYVHMNVLHDLLAGYFHQSSDSSLKLSWLILLFGALGLILIQLLKNPLVDFLGVIVLSGGLFLLERFWAIPAGYEIKLFICLFAFLLIYSWNGIFNFYLNLKEKNKVRGTFGRYLSPAVIEQMLADPDRLKVGGEKMNITIFFSDVRDFTSISEGLSPEKLSQALNYYMGEMTEIVFAHKGTLDKYIGDAIMAFWGAPLPLPAPGHAYWAVKAAFKMIEELPAVNDHLKTLGVPEFKHGIGLNTGDCSVGNMGSPKIFAYTALGDQVNLGSRLEGL
ncbi:MAG: adenylate/guanylate cyclase domain-containing protein, partial [Pseudomonadota bacterium]